MTRIPRTPLWISLLVLPSLLLAAGCGGSAPAETADMDRAAARGATPPGDERTAPIGEDPGVAAAELDADTGEGKVAPGTIMADTDTVEIELLDSSAFTVSIAPEGSLRMNDQPVSKGELPYRFRSLKRKFDEPEMLLRHPRDYPYEEVRAIIDMAQEAGITDINVMTHAQLAR
jgi:hypothetical protein